MTLDKGRKARDAKWLHEKTKGLPGITPALTALQDADHKTQADNEADTRRVQPDRYRRLKVEKHGDEVPDEVTPKNYLAFTQICNILNHFNITIGEA